MDIYTHLWVPPLLPPLLLMLIFQKYVIITSCGYKNYCQKPIIVRFFFRGTSGAIVIHSFPMVSFFACACPNRSGVGAIDSPDLFEQVFEQYDIPKVQEKISRPTFRWFVVRKCSFLVFNSFYKQFYLL